jgi:hypothetical protein
MLLVLVLVFAFLLVTVAMHDAPSCERMSAASRLPPAGAALPAPLAGALVSVSGMRIGSVGRQALRNHHDRRVLAH